MKFFTTIRFKFTLWYLAILGVLLILLASGVYFTLSLTLYRNLDESLQFRAQQLTNFRDIISIVASGTFEEEIGEIVAFYFYSNGEMKTISNKRHEFSIHTDFIKKILSGQNSFSTIQTDHSGTLRVYARQYIPDNPRIDPEIFFPEPRIRPGRIDRRNRPGEDDPNHWERYERKPEDHRHQRDRIDRQPEDHNRQRGQFDKPPEDFSRPRNQYYRPVDSNHPVEAHETALIVARPTKDTDLALKRLLQILLIAVPLTLVFAGGGGMFLAGRAFKPVDEITKTARDIEATDLSRRINVQTRDELGRLAETLNQMIERLEKAFHRQKEFTGDASHELRAPLAVIQAEATLALLKERSGSAYQKSLKTISHESENMTSIINQLLTLARADAGKERLSFTTFNLADLLKDVCTDMEVVCLEKGIDFTMNSFKPLYIRGDVRNLRSLMHNLLTNAIRYTASGGLISVDLQKEKNMALISVADTGIGIPSKELSLIFDRFYRVDKARSRETGGSGLGLAICKHIVYSHGGTIEVESQMDMGSTFYVRLPLR